MRVGKVFRRHHPCLPVFGFLRLAGPGPQSSVSVPLAPKFQKFHRLALSQSSPHPQGHCRPRGVGGLPPQGTLLLGRGGHCRPRGDGRQHLALVNALCSEYPPGVTTKGLSYEAVE